MWGVWGEGECGESVGCVRRRQNLGKHEKYISVVTHRNIASPQSPAIPEYTYSSSHLPKDNFWGNSGKLHIYKHKSIIN